LDGIGIWSHSDDWHFFFRIGGPVILRRADGLFLAVVVLGVVLVVAGLVKGIQVSSSFFTKQQQTMKQ